jgi:hypothetical protein
MRRRARIKMVRNRLTHFIHQFLAALFFGGILPNRKRRT